MVAQDKGSECMSSSNLDADGQEPDIRVPFIARLEDGELDPTMSVLVLDYEFGNSFEYD
jgi:predicted transcriptional regulator